MSSASSAIPITEQLVAGQNELAGQMAEIRLTLTELVERHKAIPVGGLAEVVGRSFETRPDHEMYEALFGGSASIRTRPLQLGLGSSVCKQVHFGLDEFRYWMKAMGRQPRLHRKEWEWFFIAQALFDRDALQPGKRGLGFAVGHEPLIALFANLGCRVLATDQSFDKALDAGWAQSSQHCAELDTLFYPSVCDRATFERNARFQNVDMNDVPAELDGGFDFCWSSCSFEHLGSLEKGMAFVERAMDTLAPGGCAVHTTEYNLTSNDQTYESSNDVVYRRRDIEQLIDRLERRGHRVEVVDWDMGRGFAEIVADHPPYHQTPHLRLDIAGFECTSIGLVITRAP